MQAGAEALHDTGGYPWYDAEQDAVRSIELVPPRPPPSRPDVPENMLKSLTGGGGFSGWGFWGLMQMLFWGVILSLIVAFFAFLITALLRRREEPETPAELPAAPSQADRIDQLPVQMKRSTSDLLGEARRQYEAGDYNEAIIYLFSHQLMELDKHHLLRLEKGRTNRQYLRDLRSRRELRDLVSVTMTAFEDVFFGGRDLNRRRFEACWSRLDRFDELLEPAAV